MLLAADLLLVGTLCAVSGGLQSPAYVYAYGIIVATAIRYGLVTGLSTALGGALLSFGLFFLVPNGESGYSTVFMSAFYSFLLAGLCGMFGHEHQQRSQQQTISEQSRAERLLSFHRTLAPLDLDDLLQQLADELTRLASCRGAGVLLIDPQRKRTDRVAASSKFLVPPANELNGSLAHGILQQALEEETIILSSGDEVRTKLQTTPRMQEWAQNNLLFVRLQTQYPLGCLVLADKKGGLPFDAVDIQMLTLVAQDMATLIERAWDVEDARHAEHTQRDSQRKIIRAQEQERKREVEEWHLPLNEKLFQVLRAFRACQELVGQRVPELKERMEHLAAELDTVAAIGRNFSNEQHPPLLAESDLVETVRDYIAGVQEQEPFTVTLEASPQLPRFSRETNLTVFRIIQEALRNIRQHAHAQNVHIAFTQEQSGVSVMITDDGQGFDVDEPLDEQYGLFYMRERVAACGGALRISSSRGHGTEIRADFPPSVEQQIVKLKRPLSSG